MPCKIVMKFGTGIRINLVFRIFTNIYLRDRNLRGILPCKYIYIRALSETGPRTIDQNKMYQLRKIRGCITTKCALTIYKTMVLPLFEYGGLFLDSCTATEQTKMQRS